MTGEVQPLDISKRAKGYQGIWKRVPIGRALHLAFQLPAHLARTRSRRRSRSAARS
jgi:hypothetical protein